MARDNSVKNTKKKIKKKIIKILAILTAIAAVVAAVAKFIDSILDKKREEKNEDSDIKEFSGLFVNKDVKLKEFGLAGIISKSCFSRINLDLKDATFKQDAFITITSNFSVVDITIPDGYSVRFDGLFNKCSVKNAFEDAGTSEPVIYIAARSNYSAIRIMK